MTYIEAVNAVLRRLREPDVSTVEQNAYTKLVAAYVNDAKRIVEGAWDWSALRTTVDVPTVADTATYSLTGMMSDPEMHGVWNDTDNRAMQEMPMTWYKQQLYTQDALLRGAPYKWVFDSVDASGDATVTVYPTPDGVYDLKFWLSRYQADLTAVDDVLLVPSWPVVLLSVAMLAEEKGETGGSTSARYFEMADKALNDAIAYDAAKAGREVDWRQQ